MNRKRQRDNRMTTEDRMMIEDQEIKKATITSLQKRMLRRWVLISIAEVHLDLTITARRNKILIAKTLSSRITQRT